jgi:hypothetical protein
MNINTTLLIFAVLAAFGLVTALVVVTPNMAQAVARGPPVNAPNEHAEKSCSNTATDHPTQAGAPFCLGL